MVALACRASGIMSNAARCSACFESFIYGSFYCAGVLNVVYLSLRNEKKFFLKR